MSEVFKTSENDKKLGEGLCDIYVMYFDETQGHIPLLVYPEEELKDNKRYMRPIKYHSIWFMDVKDLEALDHVDLEYKGYTFFGQKFLTASKRKKRRAGLEEETPETIVVILSLPNDLVIFGDELIRKLTEGIRKNFENKLFELIECEIAKQEIIKTPKVKSCIEKGTQIKQELRNSIDKTCKEYFASVVKETDATSIKQQKALSFLALKGFEVGHIISDKGEGTFSNVKLFDPNKKSEDALKLKEPFSIININIIEDSQELEFLVKNNVPREMNDIAIKITHVKEFFEREIMNQVVDSWSPGEELLFISPIIPHIDEYLFFIVEENYKGTYQKLLSKKVDLNILKKHISRN